MARCSLAIPFCTAALASHRSCRRRRTAATRTTISSATAPVTLRRPVQKKPQLPPPPLLPRPKLPPPTTTINDVDTKKTQTEAETTASLAAASDVLRLMDALRLPPDEDLYISLLRDCTDAAEVAAVHAHIAGSCGAAGLPLPLANRLLLAYAACGDIEAARKVFDEMPVKNGISWATVVSASSNKCFHHEAVRLFVRMYHEASELASSCYTHVIVAVLRSCTRASELGLGKQIHALIVKQKGVCGDVGSSLLQLYCESGCHNSARQVLEMMKGSCQEPVPEAAWTSLITACHRDGLLQEAVDVFRDMASSGVARTSFSLSSILAVCADSDSRGYRGQQVHADAIKHGINSDQFVVCGLVHMYAKHERLLDATRAFQAIRGMPDAVCWNAMIMAYARQGRYREATRVMYQMKAAGIKPSELTVNEVKLACYR